MEIISLSFPAKAENIRIARTVVRNFLLLKKVFEEDIFDTELALDEAVSNIIVHTYKRDESKYIVMTLTWKDDKNELEILLRDFGPKVDPSKIKPRPLEEVKPGGLGVYIIQKIFDVMKFKDVDVGNLLILKKKYQVPPRRDDEKE